MGFSFYIARRYLFAKKSHTAINLITGISIAGVAVGTMALVVVLSVFNGFDSLVQTLFNSFDPDLKMTPVSGKVFQSDSNFIDNLEKVKGVYYVSQVLEENAMLKYQKLQNVALIKGVDSNYFNVTGLDTLIEDGRYQRDRNTLCYGLTGRGIASNLNIGVNMFDPLFIYVPKRSENVSFNIEESFTSRYVYPTGIFTIDQDVDSKYVIVSLDFARDLIGYTKNEVTALEIKVKKGEIPDEVAKRISSVVGSEYQIQNRFQQQEIFYKIMKSEKWAIFFILAFIIMVASFNIIGSLTMLIIDKKKDIHTYNNLGAEWFQIRKIILFEGWLISGFGALLGMGLGLLVCWAQMHFHMVKLQGSGSFIIDYYPVIIKGWDLLSILLIVITIGFITSWIPSRLINRKHFSF